MNKRACRVYAMAAGNTDLSQEEEPSVAEEMSRSADRLQLQILIVIQRSEQSGRFQAWLGGYSGRERGTFQKCPELGIVINNVERNVHVVGHVQHLAQQKSQSKSDIKAEGSQAQADVYLELDVSLQSYFSEISQSAIGIIDPGINCTVSGLGKPKSGPGNQNKSVLVVKVACKGRECGWSGGVCCGNAGSSGVGRPGEHI